MINILRFSISWRLVLLFLVVLQSSYTNCWQTGWEKEQWKNYRFKLIVKTQYVFFMTYCFSYGFTKHPGFALRTSETLLIRDLFVWIVCTGWNLSHCYFQYFQDVSFLTAEVKETFNLAPAFATKLHVTLKCGKIKPWFRQVIGLQSSL